MTFSDLVLKARRRLHDLRDVAGSVITSASGDGIRWTSDELVDLCQAGLMELQRTLLSLDLERHINTANQYRIIQCSIEVGGGYGEVTNLPSTFYDIKNLQTTDASKIYTWVNQDEFFGARYLMVEDDGESIEKRIFTMVYDSVTKEMKVLVLPIPTETIDPVQAIAVISLDELYTLDSSEDLPFINMNDLLLDFIEREARRIEHNPQQLKAVNDYINFKLGTLSNEIQRSNRQNSA